MGYSYKATMPPTPRMFFEIDEWMNMLADVITIDVCGSIEETKESMIELGEGNGFAKGSDADKALSQFITDLLKIAGRMESLADLIHEVS